MFSSRQLNSSSPQEFKGKEVMVVGLSQTGGDTIVELCGVASKVILSHRAGGRIVSSHSTYILFYASNAIQIQRNPAKPTDHRITRRIQNIGLWFARNLPRLSSKLAAIGAERIMKSSIPNFSAEWKLTPAPPITNSPPVMNDHLLGLLASNAVSVVGGIRRFNKDSVELVDGRTIPVDAVIFCTGYHYNFSVMSPDTDPTRVSDAPEWNATPHKTT